MPEDQEESCPLVCHIINIQISVLAVDSVVAHELAPAPLSYSLRAPGKYDLRQLPTDEIAFVPEEFQHTTAAKKIKQNKQTNK